MLDSPDTLLAQFAPISLDEMGKVKLMNRVDTKYVTSVPALCRLLEMASNDYYVQEINGKRNMPYYTRYFDTRDTLMYCEHQRGRKVRQKVRIREYVDSCIRFLEVKTKNNKGRTKKKRVQAEHDYAITPYDEFLIKHTPWHEADLIPQLENRFNRITLVNRSMTERLTIDTSLRFVNFVTGHTHSLEGLVIIELKRDGNTPSPVLDMLRRLRIKPSGFSKYCMGMAFTNPSLRRNRIKEKLRNAMRIIAMAQAPAGNHTIIPPQTFSSSHLHFHNHHHQSQLWTL